MSSRWPWCCNLVSLPFLRTGRYLDSKVKTSLRLMFFIFVLNNAVSGLIVKQILQEAGPPADAEDIIRATAPGAGTRAQSPTGPAQHSGSRGRPCPSVHTPGQGHAGVGLGESLVNPSLPHGPGLPILPQSSLELEELMRFQVRRFRMTAMTASTTTNRLLSDYYAPGAARMASRSVSSSGPPRPRGSC